MHGGSLPKDAWFLVCSGALVNERTVVVAAHCVTDLGRVTVIKTADLKVVLGKFYRDDDRDEKSIQSLRVREGCSLEVWFLSRQLPAPGEQLFCQPVTLTSSPEPGNIRHMHAQLLSTVRLFATPRTIVHQALLSMEFSRQADWSALPCPSARDLPDPGIEPMFPVSPALETDSLPLSHQGSPSVI